MCSSASINLTLIIIKTNRLSVYQCIPGHRAEEAVDMLKTFYKQENPNGESFHLIVKILKKGRMQLFQLYIYIYCVVLSLM